MSITRLHTLTINKTKAIVTILTKLAGHYCDIARPYHGAAAINGCFHKRLADAPSRKRYGGPTVADEFHRPCRGE